MTALPVTAAQASALYALRKALGTDAHLTPMSPDGMLVANSRRAWLITPDGRTLRVEGEVS